MAIWTIEIINNSGDARDYTLYSEPPSVKFEGQPVEVYPCAWLIYPMVAPGDRRRSTFSESLAIGADFTAARLTPGMVIQNNVSTPVDARARDWLELLSGQDGQVFGPVSHDRSAYGTFSLATPDPLGNPGAGPQVATLAVCKVGDSNIPHPIAGFLPRPGGVFEVKPTGRFHLALGLRDRGEILSPNGDDVSIDFADLEDVKVTVTHEANGFFTIVYGSN